MLATSLIWNGVRRFCPNIQGVDRAEVPGHSGPRMNQNKFSFRGEGQGNVCSVYHTGILFPTTDICRLFCHYKSMLPIRLVLFLFRVLVWA